MLEPDEQSVLTDLTKTLATLGLPVLIVGAGARLLIFDRPFHIDGRTTKDWDIATKINSWIEFSELENHLTQGEKAHFKHTNIQHKFVHNQTNIEVDIVPFGAISDTNQKIIWPESGNQMTVSGFEEALNHALDQVFSGITFKTINIPSFIVLKLLAWSDRKAKKDLSDVHFILKCYTNDDRIFNELNSEIAEDEIAFEDAGILLIRQDIYTIFYEETLFKIEAILEDILKQQEGVIAPLVSSPSHGREWDADFDKIVQRFHILRYGINIP